MKILIYDWNSLGREDIEEIIKCLGHKTGKAYMEFDDYSKNSTAYLYLDKIIKEEGYEGVFSYNYFTALSLLAADNNIKYICWVYDSPLLNLYSKSIFNKSNYIFVFDKKQYTELKEYGADTVYYLPLGVNTDRLDKIILNPQEEKEYSHDISFVGSFYEKNFYDKINYMPEYLKGFIEGVIKSQLLIQGYNFMEEALEDTLIDEIKKYVKFDLGEDFFISYPKVFSALFLGQKAANIERKKIIQELGKVFKVSVYSGDSLENIKYVEKYGYIDYINVMPKVFKLSKININITLRNIETGIPLRAFDIMGSGGFLMSNYQEELCEYFVPDEDFVYYESVNDLIQKTDYYLNHEEERKNIAANGYKKVKESHNLKQRVNKMLNIVINDSLMQGDTYDGK